MVLPKFAGTPEAAVYTEAVDGRPIFVIPWNDQVLVGTTEVPDENDPAKAQPSEEEISYLWRSFQRLFPTAPVREADVLHAFAGVRPLPYSRQADPLAITRRHYFHDHAEEGAQGMISVIGGKLTTAASLARQCAAKIGIAASDAPVSAIASQDGLQAGLDRAAAQVAEAGKVSPETAHGMVEWYGEKALDIAQMARTQAELRAPLCPHTNHIVAEAVHALERECAVTLADVLLRRIPVALGACWSQACSRDAAGRIAAAVGWDEKCAAKQLEEFELEYSSFRPRRP
jgi:glycerol-3-phosphate dehydrogenase